MLPRYLHLLLIHEPRRMPDVVLFCNAGRAILRRNVRRFRQQRELTQEQLAFEAEIDLTYVGGIERGKRNPSLMVMARRCSARLIPSTSSGDMGRRENLLAPQITDVR
jgi:DNA-binding XRE family transcriptional regulator